MAGIFKAYDIRGVYGAEITEDVVFDIARAFVTFLGCKKIAVGRDCRVSSEPLFAAFAKGATALGPDVVDLGLCSTPSTSASARPPSPTTPTRSSAATRA